MDYWINGAGVIQITEKGTTTRIHSLKFSDLDFIEHNQTTQYWQPDNTFQFSVDQGLLITRSAIPEISEGDIIYSINDLPVTELFDNASKYIGGVKAFRQVECESMFPFYLFFNSELKVLHITEVILEDILLLEQLPVHFRHEFLE